MIWTLLLFAQQGDNNEGLRQTLKDVDLVGEWIYDDVDAGFAKAKQSGKPLLVVIR